MDDLDWWSLQAKLSTLSLCCQQQRHMTVTWLSLLYLPWPPWAARQQIEMILSLSRCPRWPRQVQPCGCCRSLSSVLFIDIKSLQNRLLKVCYVPATSAGLPRVSFFFSFLFLLLWPLTVVMKQTRQAVCVIKQSIFLDVYGVIVLTFANVNMA